jgi:hypothetical protein
MAENEGWKPYPDDYGHTKAMGFHTDDRIAHRLKLAGICMGLSTQAILQCLVLSFIVEFDKRTEGSPSEDALLIPFPWPAFGMGRSEYKKTLQEMSEAAIRGIAAKGMPPHEAFEAYAEAHSQATPSVAPKSSEASRNPESEHEDARDAGRKWALGIKDIEKATWVLGLEERIGPSNFPSFLEGMREVVDAFERWDKKKQA